MIWVLLRMLAGFIAGYLAARLVHRSRGRIKIRPKQEAKP